MDFFGIFIEGITWDLDHGHPLWHVQYDKMRRSAQPRQQDQQDQEPPENKKSKNDSILYMGDFSSEIS